MRHVVAHVTMAVRLTPQRFGAEMAAAQGDFGVLSDTVAARGATLPADELLSQLRSPDLHAWQPPGGGAATIPLGEPAAAPPAAVRDVLDQLTASDGAWFGVDLTGVRLEASDIDWAWGDGDPVSADSGHLAALLSGRSLLDGPALPRR